MKDHEVGELWIRYYRVTEITPNVITINSLIRKLVEERANCLNSGEHYDPDNEFIRLALRDFGIPPETWKES
jgi:hypothetical protein